ncbi:MAG: YicC/YloC family endoribonuclease [Bacteroidota bacterium]|nr:YicC/YloC family endoribonuclease [Bacteroidota bacterium]
MMQSMTGFGKVVLQLPNKKITIEIRSLNSKNIDITTRIPSLYKEKEFLIRNLLTKELDRGKIDFSIFSESTIGETSSKINPLITKEYIRQMQEIIPNADQTELLKMALRMPDVLKTEREEIDEDEWQLILDKINQVLVEFNNFRKKEGEILAQELSGRIGNITQLLAELSQYEQDRIEGVRLKLKDSLQALKIDVDANRFEQELIYYLEKYDITEEKVRLQSHLNYFNEIMTTESLTGRKLGFVAQEIGREINTIGSKSNHSQMQQKVVLMKDELEKIKEQLLNIL